MGEAHSSDRLIRKARFRQEVISAIRQIVQARQPASSKPDIGAVILEIGARSHAVKVQKLTSLLERCADVSRHELPFPVLSTVGGGHKEVQWTQYIASILRFEGEGSCTAGGPLALALANSILQAESQECATQVEVYDETYLGVNAGRGRTIDFLLVGDNWVIGIEHKTVSPSSDGASGGQEKDMQGKQADAYRELLTRHCESGQWTGRKLYLRYLAPSDRTDGGKKLGYKDWKPMSHAELAGILAPALAELNTRASKYAASAALYDLTRNFGGNLLRCVVAHRQWCERPDDYQAVAELVDSLVDAGNLASAFTAILEANHA